jgi:hypothetical protein
MVLTAVIRKSCKAVSFYNNFIAAQIIAAVVLK